MYDGSYREVRATTVQEMQKRADAITDIWASWALEGMQPTDFDRELAEAYIRGELTLEQVRERVLARYAVR